MKNIVIRAACPEDVDFLAWVALSASRLHISKGFWDIIVNDSDEYILFFIKKILLSSNPNFCHYSSFIIAEMDEKYAGAVSGFANNDPSHTPMFDVINEVALLQGWSHEKTQSIYTRLKVMEACVPDSVESSWEIEWAACLPNYRRRGIITGLIQQILRIGKEKNHNVAQVLIRTNNTPALIILHKFGFTKFDEKRSDEFEKEFGNPGFTRLTLNL